MPNPIPVLVDTTHGPHALLHPVPLTAVTLADDFWAPRRRLNREVVLPAGAAFQSEFCPELLGGVVVLRTQAGVVPPDAGWAGRLYRPAGEVGWGAGQPVAITAVPYYAWANRGANPMQVWLRT
jgi:DUF1680 family protein